VKSEQRKKKNEGKGEEVISFQWAVGIREIGVIRVNP
jgi:hypothetical protein